MAATKMAAIQEWVIMYMNAAGMISKPNSCTGKATKATTKKSFIPLEAIRGFISMPESELSILLLNPIVLTVKSHQVVNGIVGGEKAA